MNRLKKAGFILLAVFFIAMFYGCTTQANVDEEAYPWELGTFEGLNAKTEWRIIQDYYDAHIRPYIGNPVYSMATINQLRIINYYGTYNGYVVVLIEDGLPYFMAAVMPSPYQIDSIVFPWLYPSHPFPTVWNNGKFYDIAELYYESRQLTLNNLVSIANYPQRRDFP
jgi:hypothetical protein